MPVAKFLVELVVDFVVAVEETSSSFVVGAGAEVARAIQ